MKKIFTLVVMAAMAISVNAQSEWNFSNWTAEDISETKTVDGLTAYAGDGKNVAIDGGTATIDDISYTQRLKFGGSGQFDEEGMPLARVLAFDVTGPSTIYIAYTHASSSGDSRTLAIDAVVDGVSNEVGTLEATAGEKVSGTVEYSGAAATIYVYSKKSGINLYAIKVTPKDGGSGIAGVEAIQGDGKTAVFNLAGQRVSKDAKGLLIQNGKKIIKK